jgi:energy-coupling factor transport system substrate-specific component
LETPVGEQIAVTGVGEWDELTKWLQELRVEAGEPAFGEIARRISKLREAQGLTPHQARIARSTVFDAFQLGRTRLNLALMREIASVLGASDEQVEEWIGQARPNAIRPPTPLRIVLLLLACLALNFAGRWLVTVLHLPIYMDMVGTALASLALGPWRGALVGGLTNIGGALISTVNSIPFGLVNIAGALVWGYGVRRFRFGSSLARFLALNLLVALVCSLIAVPILLMLYGGSVGHAEDLLGQRFVHLIGWNVGAIFIANFMTSIADKVLSGFMALVAISALPAGMCVGWKFRWSSSSSRA